MRIYSNSFELMSELGRELNSYGQTVKPKTYQNQVIEGKEGFETKELICQQYCLTSLGDPVWLFVFSHSKEWADAEFDERIGWYELNPGKAWELRKDLWEQFLVMVDLIIPIQNVFGINYICMVVHHLIVILQCNLLSNYLKG